MAEPAVLLGNETVVEAKYNYSSVEVSWLFSAIAIGSIVGTFFAVKFTHSHGLRKVFTTFGFITATATVLTPLAADSGYAWLIVTRLCQGFSFAITFPVMGVITSHWSPLTQSGTFLTVLNCCFQTGPLFTMPISGFFCTSSFGWTAVYYAHALCTYLAFVVFYCFYRDQPSQHGCVSEAELAAIREGKSEGHGEKQPIPFRAILSSLPIWGVWMSYFGCMVGVNLFIQFGPTYLNKVLNYDLQNTGLAGATPYIISAVLKVLAGPVSDYATCVSQKVRVVIFTLVSQGVPTACLLTLAFLPDGAHTAGFLCYLVAITAFGMTPLSSIKSGQLVASQHAHFVMAVSAFLNSLIVLLLPTMVTSLAPENTSGQPAEWTKTPPQPQQRVFAVKESEVNLTARLDMGHLQ
uniref:MFS domain-containing protein n=1 Tax=Steinernema glaseri TaxID=37863 RepID=A0A1I8A3U4_9BILA